MLLATYNIYCLLCFIFVKSKHFPKDQSAANLSLLHLSRLFRASLQKVLSFKIPQKDIGWTRKVTMNFSYIFYGISSHKKSFLTAFYLIFILDFFISRGERKIKKNIFKKFHQIWYLPPSFVLFNYIALIIYWNNRLSDTFSPLLLTLDLKTALKYSLT